MSLQRASESARIETPTMTTTLLAPSSATGGDFGLFDVRLPADAPGPVPHRHEGFSETFYVLEGTLALRSGEERLLARPGDLFYVPRQGVHAFRPDRGAVRFLLLFTPGTAREQYFAEMVALADRAVPPTDDEVDAIARRHDQINCR